MSDCCREEIKSLREDFQKLSVESKELKQNLQQLLAKNYEKDVVIRKLKEKVQSKKFISCNGVLTTNCLDELKCLSNLEAEDSKFIGAALNDLYRENVDVLKKKTLSGRSKDGEKSIISPTKMDILKSLFAERLSFIPSEEVSDIRRNSLKKLIRNAIDAANKKK